MARPRRPLWKRPYTSFRHGDRARPDLGNEPQRLTLYLPGRMLDLAEILCNRAGALTVQLFCEDLLTRTLEAERSIGRVAEAEEKHGPFEGLNEVTDDLEYLAEWNASVARRDGECRPRPGLGRRRDHPRRDFRDLRSPPEPTMPRPAARSPTRRPKL